MIIQGGPCGPFPSPVCVSARADVFPHGLFRPHSVTAMQTRDRARQAIKAARFTRMQSEHENMKCPYEHVNGPRFNFLPGHVFLYSTTSKNAMCENPLF